MKTCALLALAAGIGIPAGGATYVYSGRADVSALSPHWRPIAWALSTAMTRAVRRSAAPLTPPGFLAREERLQNGAREFDAMCSGCHGAPDGEQDPAGRGLNPAPPDLTQHAGNWSVSEIFWITKNGIRMTGMPAFGPTHRDETLWDIAGFVALLPDLSESEYRRFAGKGADRSPPGHHEPGEALHTH
jgi:mono/diheme cytochrome c family protein